MPLKGLSVKQQKALLKSLSAPQKKALKAHVKSLHMKGEGFMDILKSAGKFLSPIIQDVGPIVLKDFILPFLKKKMEGNGLNPAGTGLKLAGQGRLVKGSPEAKAFMAKVRAAKKK